MRITVEGDRLNITFTTFPVEPAANVTRVRLGYQQFSGAFKVFRQWTGITVGAELFQREFLRIENATATNYRALKCSHLRNRAVVILNKF